MNHYPSIIGFGQFVQLKDFKPRTQKDYLWVVGQCSKYFGADPATLTESQLREYFLFLRQQRELSPTSMRVAKCALQTFFISHLKKGLDWKVFEDLRIRPGQTLPLVLSHEEVIAILSHLRQSRFIVCLRLIYHTGLRVGEAVTLRVQDLRETKTNHPHLHIRQAKGGKDRCVPLSQGMLEELREWWKQHKNPSLLFPSPGRGQTGSKYSTELLAQATKPMSIPSVQHAFHLALQVSRIDKPASVHTLRHSYATRLLEAGIGIRQIAQYLGHQSLNTTLIYTHLTTVSETRTRAALDQLYQRLNS